MWNMKNITLAIEDKLLEESREYARKQRTTVNGLVRKLLEREVSGREPGEAVGRFLDMAKQGGGRSRGWKWNREELYDRQVLH